jgi:hypothetical protein
MKRRQPTTLSVLMTAVAIVAAAALLSATVAPHNLAFAEKGGNGKGNNGNGKGNGGGNGAGNGNGNAGGNGKGNGNGNGNGNSNGNGKALGHQTADDAADADQSDDAGTEQPGNTVPDEHMPNGRDRIVRSEVVVADANAGLNAFALSKGFQVVQTENLDALGLHVTRLQAPEGVSATQARNLITQQYPDAIVDFNHLYQPQTSVSLPAADYAVKAVRWSSRLRECGVAARIGLIDTAVDWSLPILNGAHRQSAAFLGAGIVAAPPQHGTGIATVLVGQEGFGLLPGAELYSASIFGVDGDGEPVASATSFASALNWLLTNKVATINVSLSGPPDLLMELAVKRAQQRGAELVAAVGNDGTTDVPRFPAAYSGVIGVTAVDQAGQVFSGANRGNFVALAAPGVNLLIPGQPSAAGTIARLVTGTSFAAPYVTAALASYGNNPTRMFADAVDLGTPGPDPIFGRGLVQGPAVCTAAASAD